MKGEKLWKQFLETDEEGRPLLKRSKIAGISRRSFLTALGYTAAGLSLMSCRVPEQKIIPYLATPPEFLPGKASWYASTCSGCSAGCGALVKVRDGRPIKLEGNPDHPLSKGGLCPVAHSLVFGLYDPERLRAPMSGGKTADWKAIDSAVGKRLTEVKDSGGKVVFLSNSAPGPTSTKVIDRFISGFEGGAHVVYEPVSVSAIREAHKRTHGVGTLPTYEFGNAEVIVGFDADFLGSWISPVQFTKGYASKRDLKNGAGTMSLHVQFESRMSLTGANADRRIRTTTAEQTRALLLLAKLVSSSALSEGGAISSFDEKGISAATVSAVKDVAERLQKAGGNCLVVSGSNDPDAQQIVNSINNSLGAYGKTVLADKTSFQNRGDEASFGELVNEMNEGAVSAVLMLDVNPAYDSPLADEFVKGLKKVPLKVSFARRLDETSSLADYICPDHHRFESWDDFEAVSGTVSFNQPTISPLFRTRAYQESLLQWGGEQGRFYDFLRSSWETEYFPKQTVVQNFDEFWDRSLQDGVFVYSPDTAEATAFDGSGVDASFVRLAKTANKGYSLVLYQKTAMRDGRYASSPWLQELPDPLTKTTWDNYACVSAETAERLGVQEGRVVSLKSGSRSLELPVLIQPGQSDDTVAVALGYGREKAGPAGSGVGGNAYRFVGFAGGSFRYQGSTVEISPTERDHQFAKTQITNSAITRASHEERDLVKEMTISQFAGGGGKLEQKEFEKLFPAHKYPDHKWGMAIDLSACTGCNSCVLSCQAENNSPVVGKAEVALQRDLQWLRIDRYYKDIGGDVKTQFQPLPCMQCENAPCEMVCPVLATVHSSDGLNMQVYNRCVGTRYCANNCAYKVRHFNWFAYPHEDEIANLALNPDVTVRSRGVMEKCTFCVQRIEEKKIIARNEGRKIKDGEIQTACQQSCPADAIIFGDLADLKSRVNEAAKSGRSYVLLEDLNTRPAVTYMAKIRNVESKGEDHA